tara:strand:- start:320 stop:472 length:153 start_codon:yes stop_codon:yes gene_type:complete
VGLLKYDSVNKIEKTGERFPFKNDLKNKRQYFRKKFSQFVIKDVKEKYSH